MRWAGNARPLSSSALRERASVRELHVSENRVTLAAENIRWRCCRRGRSGQNLGLSGGDPPNPPCGRRGDLGLGWGLGWGGLDYNLATYSHGRTMTNMPLMVFWGTAVLTLMAALMSAGASAKVALDMILKLLIE